VKKSSKIIFSVISAVVMVVLSIIFFTADFLDKKTNINLLNYNESKDAVSIHNLHIDAEVSKENKLKVTETFSVTFNKSGLTEVVRLIPYVCYNYRQTEGGKVEKDIVLAQIYDIQGSGDNQEVLKTYVDEEDGFLTIGLKSSTFIPKGETRQYQMSYTYDLGKGYNKKFDDVYFNLVGTNSLLTIRNITFAVSLPTDIEETKSLNVYYGKEGATTEINYETSGNVFTGSIEKLNPLEGITFRVVFENGYLTSGINFSWKSVAMVLISSLLIGLAILSLFKYKQRELIMPIELIAPENMNAFNAEYYSEGTCSKKAVIASIVCLASKGYLKINELQGGAIELIKVKDILDNEDSSLKAIFNSIFKGVNQIELGNLGVSFSTASSAVITSEKIKGDATLYDNNAKKKSQSISGFTFLMIILFCFFMITMVFDFWGFSAGYFSVRLLIISFILFVMALLSLTKFFKWYMGLIVTAFLTIMACYLYFVYGFKYIDGLCLGLIAIIVISLSISLQAGETKYSENGARNKGRVLGFKRFIETCEVSRLKMFAEENPNYYFDVLPYAYVFDLTDVWIKKFEQIDLTIPEWITSNGMVITDVLIFNSLYRNFVITTSMVSTRLSMAQMQGFSNSSTGGGFSGGGFSGGGGGGFSGGGSGGGGFGAR